MKHTHPKISILLHNYNHAEYLNRALTYIENQTQTPYEVIILDDGSTDNSCEIIECYSKKNSHFKSYVNHQNMGIVYSMNKLLNSASGDYVMFTASDDILLPFIIERYSSILEENDDTGLIHSCGATFRTEEDISNYLKLDTFKKSDYLVIHNIKSYTANEFINTCKHGYINICSNTVLCNKNLLQAYGGFAPELKWHTDWFAFYTIALRHKTIMLNEYLTLYYINDCSFHKKGMRDKTQQSVVINQIFNKLLQPNNIDLLQAFTTTPYLLTLFKPILLLECCIKNPKNLKFLMPALRYLLCIPKQKINNFKFKIFTFIRSYFPICYKTLKTIKNGFNNAKT